jgi:hypothetical protein
VGVVVVGVAERFDTTRGMGQAREMHDDRTRR